MKTIFKFIGSVLLLIFISNTAVAQDHNAFKTYDAVMLQVNGNMQIESTLKEATIVLFNNSSQLNVRINIPHRTNNYLSDNTTISDPGLWLDLTVPINLWKIQDKLTSTKVFTTTAPASMNYTNNTVRVEYIPLPLGPDQDGKFKVLMTIRFKSSDFNLNTEDSDTDFIIKISDAAVNRM